MNNMPPISCPNDYYAKMKKIGFLNQNSNNLHEFEILKEYGTGQITRYTYENGLDISWGTLCLKKDFSFAVQIEKKLFFEITYITSGYIEVYDACQNKSYQIKAGEYCIHLSKDRKSRSIYPTNVTISYINIIISEEFLCSQDKKNLISEINNLGIFYRTCICPIETHTDIKAIMEKTINCYYANELARKLFFQATTLELISEWMTHVHFIQSAQKLSNLILTSDDISLLYQAKQELFEQMSHPPSIELLAKNLCLNTHKLKLGFKVLFANTPYGYLRDIRLEKARALLKNTDCSIGNVASQIGYNISSFVTIFKKKYGVTPKQYRKEFKAAIANTGTF